MCGDRVGGFGDVRGPHRARAVEASSAGCPADSAHSGASWIAPAGQRSAASLTRSCSAAGGRNPIGQSRTARFGRVHVPDLAAPTVTILRV